MILETKWILLFVGILQILIFGFVALRFSPAARRFIYNTFVDVTGRPDAKLLTAFATFNLIAFLVLRGSFFKESWPPEALINSLLTFCAVLLGIDAGVTGAKFFSKDPKPIKEDE